MGNDGGSIPTRRELVKEAAKDPNTTQVKETQTEKLQYYWSHCSLSQNPLTPPIVSDSTGNLYNKDAILEDLLDTSKDNQDRNVAGNERTAGTIKTLRDIVEVRFSIEDQNEESKLKPNELRMVCPVTGKRLGPGVKAVYLVPCGHAFAETAVREMPGNQCLEVSGFLLLNRFIADELQCNEPYTTDNIIPILPVSSADKNRLRDRLAKLQSEGLTHSLKKASGSSKKRKKVESLKEPEAAGALAETAGPNLPPNEAGIELSSDVIRNEGTAALTAKVLAEQEDHNKRRKMAPNENLKGLFSSSNGTAGKKSDFMTRGFSIPAGAKR
ncbi:MAG: hypothetical protein Q9209_000910 [Squamulea sp. 1 TL-2023]